MKNGFTLVESLVVLVIISVITTVMFNMRLIGTDNRNVGQEAVNTFYKEMQILLRDLNRNKIYNSGDNKYEISYFIIESDGTGLKISNQYINPNVNGNKRFLQYVEKVDLIDNKHKYSATNAIKGVNDLYFKVIKVGINNNFVLVSKNGIVETGDIEKAINKGIPNGIPTVPENDNECINILNGCESNQRSELIISCLDATNFYKKNCPNILDFNTSRYAPTQGSTKNFSIIICAGETKTKINQPVGKITINVAGKNTSLERCNNDTVTNGIDCGKNICK